MADQTRFSSDRRDNPQSMQHILMPPKQATLYPTMAHPFHTSGYYPHPGPFAPHPQSFEPFIQQQPYIPFPPPNNFRVPLAPVSPGLVNFQAERPTDPNAGESQESTAAKRSYQAAEIAAEAEDEGVEELVITDNCDEIRSKINSFISSGEMRVTEFQREIGVNSNSFNKFLKQRGPTGGIHNQTRGAAFEFFQNRKASGKEEVPKKKMKKNEETKKFDVSDIQLPGEEGDSVQVYDTCDELRRKIAAYLREPNVTQAAFLRELCKMYTTPRKIQSKQLKDFQAKKGALAGNTSCVCYASYVFFEKLRIKQGTPKTKTRQNTEEAWAGTGIDRRAVRTSYWVRADDAPVEDKYGKVNIQRGRG